MPCGEVLGRIHVRVSGVSAGGAGEDSLALAVLIRNMPARRAALGGVRGVNLLHPARGLLLQPLDQDSPAGGGDLPVEPGFLTHVLAGVADSAFRCRYRAGPAEPHPSGLRDVDLPGLAVQPPDLAGPKGHDPESLITPGFAPGGLAVRASEEVGHGLGEIPQRLLLYGYAP